MAERILVIRDGALGDLILTLPALAALRRTFPVAHITLAGNMDYLPLARLSVDEIVPLNFKGNDFTDIICYEGIRPDEHTPQHAAQTYLKAACLVDVRNRIKSSSIIRDADYIPRLAIKHQPSTVNRLAVHCGSASPHKCWPERLWAELLTRLAAEEHDLQFLIVSGPSEHDKAARLGRIIPDGRGEVVRLPLCALAQRLVVCTAFIGQDSGVTHLAAALGLPVCVLWSGSDERVWKPLATKLSLVKNVSNISVAGARAALREVLL